MQGKIVFEDKYLIVFHKPAGLSVSDQHPDAISVETELMNYCKQTHQPKNFLLGFPHRLDKQVEGLMIIAKKPSVLKDLNKQFELNQVKKKYIALTRNKLSQTGKLNLFHQRTADKKKAIISINNGVGFKPITMQIFENGDNMHFFEYVIDLISGKYHQIRAVFSFLKAPIAGDLLYGDIKKFTESGESIALKCVGLSFQHPVSLELLQFEIEGFKI
jgi:23S rRNA-/tRNA-specific pseudouridylate synthase